MESLGKLVLLILLCVLVKSARISPKLDFDDQSELVQVKKEIIGGKIKGLRVTVDTSELKESKSSDSGSTTSSESNEKKKTIGVRTDVTFELTSGETNDTKSFDEKEIGKGEDASIPLVPVFKGKPDKGGNNDLWSVRPLENPNPSSGGSIFHQANDRQGGPIFHQTNDRPGGYDSNRPGGYDGSRQGGSDDESWKQYPQYAIWTTERYNRKHDQPVYHQRDPYDIYQRPSSNFIPNQGNRNQDRQHQHDSQSHHDRHHAPWQPCTCKEYPGPYISPHQPSSNEHRNQKVDDKLERPFSKTS